MLTDVEAPFLGTPLVPLKLYKPWSWSCFTSLATDAQRAFSRVVFLRDIITIIIIIITIIIITTTHIITIINECIYYSYYLLS